MRGVKNFCSMSSQVVPASSIPDGWMGLDIGPDSIKTFSESLDTTQTVIWNGPMGVFEFDKFAAGTDVIIYIHKHDILMSTTMFDALFTHNA